MDKDWRKRAHRLRAIHPDWSNADIAERCGVHTSSVWRLFNPERSAEGRARDNAKRKASKREWEREHDRRPCEAQGCDNLLSVGAHRGGATICRECYDRDRRAERVARGEHIAQLWRDGESLSTIASAVGMTVNVLGTEMVRLRREGLVDLPYRYNVVNGRRAA